MVKSLFYSIFTLIIFLSCLKHQEHEVLAPEIPHYRLTGQITDVDTHLPLSGIEVTIQALLLLHKSDFSSSSTITDNLGRYEISYVIPGNYFIEANRDGYFVFKDRLSMYYSDKRIDLTIPKPYVTSLSFNYPDVLNFKGFCWKYANVFAGVSENWDTHEQEVRIYEGYPGKNFKLLGDKKLRIANPPLYSLVFFQNYWSCFFDSLESKAKIVSLDSKGGVMGKTTIAFDLSDLTTDGTHLWASTRNGRILKFGQHPSVLQEIYETPGTELGGIGWDGQNLWVADIKNTLIYKLDENIKVKQTFKPLFQNELTKQVDVVRSISFFSYDSRGNLWVGQGGKLIVFTRL